MLLNGLKKNSKFDKKVVDETETIV
jgi:hypothetical protein